MSIAQMAQFLGGIPENGPQPTHYFMYNHHFLHKEFEQEFLHPLRSISLGYLKGWTWHINQLQKANIRFTFKDDRIEAGGPVIFPATEFDHQPKVNGTFGLIFKLTPELRAKLKKHYAGMAPMIQEVHLAIRTADGGPMRSGVVKALVYWDPLYTADGLAQNLLVDEDEKKKWRQGLGVLHAAGVPEDCLYAIQRRLTGERVDPEPLWSDFIQPEVVELWKRLKGRRRIAQPLPVIQNPVRQDGRMAVTQPNPMIQGRIGQDGRTPIAQLSPMIHGRICQEGRTPTVQPNSMIQGRIGQNGRTPETKPMIQGQIGQDGKMAIARPNSMIHGQIYQDGKMAIFKPNSMIHDRIYQDGRMAIAETNPMAQNQVGQGVTIQVAAPITQSQLATHQQQTHRPIAQPWPAIQRGAQIIPTPPRLSLAMPIGHPQSTIQGQNKRKADSGEAREELKRMRIVNEKSIVQID